MAKKKSSVDPLAPVRTAPESVKELCLNPSLLAHSKIDYEPTPAFPREVLACKNLESLDLFRGIEYRGDNTIPEEIGSLVKLVSLTLGGLQMTSLPESIGRLIDLRELDLSYAASLQSLPDSVGELANLEALRLFDANKLAALPASVGRLSKLGELHLRGTALAEVPPELWRLKALRSLSLPETVRSLPPGIAALSSLDTLYLSAKALLSIAGELPAMAALESIRVAQGKERWSLPETIGRLPRLKSLQLAFTGLTALPASLADLPGLEELDVAGNPIESLEELVASLPALIKLDFSGTAIGRTEKRRIDALMKLPPGKRKPNAPLAPRPKLPKPKQLGTVSAENASLSMLLADVRVAREWKGARGGDWERMCEALDGKDAASLDVGGGDALALTLAMGSGRANVYRIGESIAIVEGFLDDWEDVSFLEDLAAPPDETAKKVGAVVVDKGLLLLSGTSRTSDEDSSQLVVKLDAGPYDVVIEAEKTASWGSVRRAWVIKP